MLIKSKRLNSSGDTIVEVMIVLAVLSLAFAISLSIANKGLQQSRNAEEHSHGLGILNSQVEVLRSAIAKDADVFKNQPFCMTASNAPSPNVADINKLDGTGYPGECKEDIYYKSITYNSAATPPYFELRVRWDGIGSLGRQQENLSYRITKLAFAVPPPINLTSPPVGGGGGGGGGGPPPLLMTTGLRVKVNGVKDCGNKNNPAGIYSFSVYVYMMKDNKILGEGLKWAQTDTNGEATFTNLISDGATSYTVFPYHPSMFFLFNSCDNQKSPPDYSFYSVKITPQPHVAADDPINLEFYYQDNTWKWAGGD
jgi:type II secretory pathway pseudopilin PulG